MRSLQFQIESFLFLIYQIFEPSANFSAEFKSLLSAANHGIPCVSNMHFMLNIESLLCFCVGNFNKILTYNSYCSQFSKFMVHPVMHVWCHIQVFPLHDMFSFSFSDTIMSYNIVSISE